MLYDIDDTAEVMRWYRELLPSLPEELSGWFALLTIPPAPPFPEELWGRKACGDRLVLHRRRTTGPTRCSSRCGSSAHRCSSACSRCRSPCCRARSTRSTRPACSGTGASDFFAEISDAAIEVHRKFGAQLPTGHSTMHLYPIDGAASRVPADATAFAYRDGGWAGVIVGVDPDPANAQADLAVDPRLLGRAAPDLGRRRLRQLHDGRGAGAGQGVVPAATTTGSPRSSAATTRENVFHVNQNIHPEGS